MSISKHIYAILNKDLDYLSTVSPGVFSIKSTKTPVKQVTRIPRRQTKYDPYINQSHSSMGICA